MLSRNEYESLFTPESLAVLPFDEDTWLVLEMIEKFLRHVKGTDATGGLPRMLDAGAGIGTVSLIGYVIPVFCVACEPNPDMVELLNANIVRNPGGGQIVLIRVALFDQDAMLPLNIPLTRKQAGLATLGTPSFRGTRKVLVAAVPLDDLEHSEVPFDLMKFDIEGAELPALRGAERIILRDRPAIIVEAQDKRTMQLGYKADRITELLTGWGYRWQKVSKRDLYFWQKPEHDPATWGEA